MKDFLFAIIDFIVPKRWYIRHDVVSIHDPSEVIESNYFGPFLRWTVDVALTDEYAALLLYGGDGLEKEKMSWSRARAIPFIASEDYWNEQNNELEDDEPAAWAGLVEVEAPPERIYYFSHGRLYRYGLSRYDAEKGAATLAELYRSEIYFYGPADLKGAK